MSLKICPECKEIAEAILTASTASSTKWQTIDSGYDAVTYVKNHRGNCVKNLISSKESGCKFCSLLLGQLEAIDSSPSETEYCIFIWGQRPSKCELNVAWGDVNRFAEHISQWKQPKSLIFYTREGQPEAETEDGYRPPLYIIPNRNPGSSKALSCAIRWLTECFNRHQKCVRPPPKLPKRVLDLSETMRLDDIHLYITKGEECAYAALSYSWGQATTIRTRPDNIEQRCQGIPFTEFPKTQQDGLFIAKALGFRYIWIDSLCIIQGDKLDWAEQGAAMTEIYGRSTLNISATSTKTSDEGFLKPIPDPGFRHDMSCTLSSARRGLISVGPSLATLDLEEKFISTRGWVFQERLVSPATLHYTDEGLVWECASETKVSHDQDIFSTQWKANWKYTIDWKGSVIANSSNLSQKKSRSKIPYEAWNEWICAYSERNLFRCDDKFPAIAGVAKAFGEAFNLNYVAGLWEEDIVAGLMWRRHNRRPTLERFDIYVAPSWSWASVHGRLEYRRVDLIESIRGPSLRIIDIVIDEEQPGAFGRLRFGKLVVNGLMQQVILDKSFHPGVRKRPFQECGIHSGFKNKTNVLCMLDELKVSDEPLYHCWCLRLCSYDSYGREGDRFLLLKQVDRGEDEFYRVGFAETDPWEHVWGLPDDSGYFDDPSLRKISII